MLRPYTGVQPRVHATDVASIRDYAERYVGYRLDYMGGATAAPAR